MGYKASADGWIQFMESLDEEQETKFIDLLEGEFTGQMEDLRGKTVAYISRDSDWNFYAEYTMEALTKVSNQLPVEDAEINFEGDDGTFWRFRYKNKNWVVEDGGVVFDGDDDPTDVLNRFIRIEIPWRIKEIHNKILDQDKIDQITQVFIDNSDLLFDYERIDTKIDDMLEKET